MNKTSPITLNANIALNERHAVSPAQVAKYLFTQVDSFPQPFDDIKFYFKQFLNLLPACSEAL